MVVSARSIVTLLHYIQERFRRNFLFYCLVFVFFIEELALLLYIKTFLLQNFNILMGQAGMIFHYFAS